MASTTITEFDHLKIPLEDVEKATNNFHTDNVIGRGGLGIIYRGELRQYGKLIKISAIRLHSKQGEGHIQFWMEVSILSDIRHTNIVSLIGFCDEKNEKIIITNYAAKGSLKKNLNNPNLTWTQRLKICVGVARALSYLHYFKGRDYGVIHHNISSSTILLDENYEPRLSGFKHSIKHSLNRMEQVILSKRIGTLGYMDPDIIMSKGVTHKSDVYAFGVVLFEILCGRTAYIEKCDRFLAEWVKYHYQNGTLLDKIQHDLKNQMSRNQMSLGSLKKYLKTAYSCLHEERTHRPDMLTIVDELKKALEKALKFQPPPENFGKNMEHLKIPLDDIKLATNNFSDIYKTRVGKYCISYTAELHHFDKEKPPFIEGKSKSELPKVHTNVVIKRYLAEIQDDEELFFTEFEILSSVKHQNIVTLIGFCMEGLETILVTEEFSNGLVWDYLGNANKMSTLTWEKRLKICIDLAQAFNYLHYEMKDKKNIIHTSINSSKFGLDENWRAKIVDFESTLFLHPNEKHKAMRKRMYFFSKYHEDPEIAQTREIKRESDVYSFGVVLFEILSGRRANDIIYLKKSNKGLVHFARQHFYNGTIHDMIDPILKAETSKKGYFPNREVIKDSLTTFIKVASKCVEETRDQRPTMKVVLNELEKALFFQVSQEKLVQQPSKDQVEDEMEKETYDIPVPLIGSSSELSSRSTDDGERADKR